MKKYEFTLILKGSPGLTEEIADALFAAGCDDGSPGTCNGVLSIDFHRTADSLETAIGAAIRNVKAAGYDVERAVIEAEAMPQSKLSSLAPRSNCSKRGADDGNGGRRRFFSCGN